MFLFFAWLLSLVAAGIALGLAYQRFGAQRDLKKFPPNGRLVNIGGHRLHILETGSGSGPTILLEAGLMSTTFSWTGVQRELAQSFRVVSYDRAGLGWSDPGPLPRTTEQIVTELHTLLRRAGIPPPYVLVGHSFGGLTMPLFAARYRSEVAGMVLVDPVAAPEWNPPSAHDLKQTRIGAKVCSRAALLARIGVLRFVAALLSGGTKPAAARLVRLISRGAPTDSGTVSSPWFSALPVEEKNMAAVFWVQPKFAAAIASQLENLPEGAARLGALGHFCDETVVILSAQTAPPHRRKAHAAMAAQLPGGLHILAEKSNHWIMQQQPELVIGAIEKVAADYAAKRRAATLAAAAGSRG